MTRKNRSSCSRLIAALGAAAIARSAAAAAQQEFVESIGLSKKKP